MAILLGAMRKLLHIVFRVLKNNHLSILTTVSSLIFSLVF